MQFLSPKDHDEAAFLTLSNGSLGLVRADRGYHLAVPGSDKLGAV